MRSSGRAEPWLQVMGRSVDARSSLVCQVAAVVRHAIWIQLRRQPKQYASGVGCVPSSGFMAYGAIECVSLYKFQYGIRINIDAEVLHLGLSP